MKQKLMFAVPKNKKGQVGLDVVKGVIMTLLVLGVTAIAVFLALSNLQNANLFTAGSTGANNTNFVINNVTGGVVDFFENVPTIMVVLGAVVIILVVALIIIAVRRFGGSGSL